jgi:hypothetical protein
VSPHTIEYNEVDPNFWYYGVYENGYDPNKYPLKIGSTKLGDIRAQARYESEYFAYHDPENIKRLKLDQKARRAAEYNQ